MGAQAIQADSAESQRSEIFISYSHADRKWLSRLEVATKPLERKHLVTMWADTAIKPGDDWRQAISGALSRARIAVLLVSQNFLASDFVAGHELPPLLIAARDRGLRICSIMVSPCLYQETELRNYQFLNPPDRPLDGMRVADRNKALNEIAQAIRDLIQS
jgi:TIR domain